MDLIKREYTISTSWLGDWIVYLTKFKDCRGNNISIYQRVNGNYFTDDGHTVSDLEYFVPNWREDGAVAKICKLYNCEMVGDNEEIQSSHSSRLIQAIIAIYTFIDLKKGYK